MWFLDMMADLLFKLIEFLGGYKEDYIDLEERDEEMTNEEDEEDIEYTHYLRVFYVSGRKEKYSFKSKVSALEVFHKIREATKLSTTYDLLEEYGDCLLHVINGKHVESVELTDENEDD